MNFIKVLSVFISLSQDSKRSKLVCFKFCKESWGVFFVNVAICCIFKNTTDWFLKLNDTYVAYYKIDFMFTI